MWTMLMIIGALVIGYWLFAFVLTIFQLRAINATERAAWESIKNVRPTKDYWADGWDETF